MSQSPVNGSPQHAPNSDLWICVVCFTPWPCPTRRGELIVESNYSKSATKALMTTLWLDAIKDRPVGTVRSLWQQIVGWVDEP